MLQTTLSVAAIVVPIALAAAAWARSVDHRLDNLEQGQIGLSLQLQAASRVATRRAGEREE